MTPQPYPENCAGRANHILLQITEQHGIHSWQAMTALMVIANLAEVIGLSPAENGKPPGLVLKFQDNDQETSILTMSLSPEATDREIHQVITDVIQTIVPSANYPIEPEFPPGPNITNY